MADNYLIRVRGQINPSWSEWFGDLTVSCEGMETILAGTVHDQAALHGLLAKVRDLGLFLISVQLIPCNSEQLPGKRTKRQPLNM